MSEAYKWLQTLPPNVREDMKSMEQVVNFYLRAKRLGHLPTKEDLANLPSPPQEPSKSSQEFQKTLKNLRHELDQFDFSPPTNQSSFPLEENGQAAAASPAGNRGVPTGPSQGTKTSHSESESLHHNTSALLSALRLDPRSRQVVNEIREGLNLSSDAEVIRLSLVLAHKALKDLLK